MQKCSFIVRLNFICSRLIRYEQAITSPKNVYSNATVCMDLKANLRAETP